MYHTLFSKNLKFYQNIMQFSKKKTTFIDVIENERENVNNSRLEIKDIFF